jgi:hypothetical protein
MQGKYFDIPVFEWFDNGGKYSGSKRVSGEEDFNYRLTPDKKGGTLTLDLWRGVFCFEKSESYDSKSFELAESGFDSAKEYIDMSLEKLLT